MTLNAVCLCIHMQWSYRRWLVEQWKAQRRHQPSTLVAAAMCVHPAACSWLPDVSFMIYAWCKCAYMVWDIHMMYGTHDVAKCMDHSRVCVCLSLYKYVYVRVFLRVCVSLSLCMSVRACMFQCFCVRVCRFHAYMKIHTQRLTIFLAWMLAKFERAVVEYLLACVFVLKCEREFLRIC